MNIYPDLSEKDINNLVELSEHQKNQRAIKIKKRILKQTHDKQIAETFKSITKKLPKSTESIGNFSLSETKN